MCVVGADAPRQNKRCQGGTRNAGACKTLKFGNKERGVASREINGYPLIITLLVMS